jgi:hypothetical protein
MLPLASETKLIVLALLIIGVALLAFTLRVVIMAPSVVGEEKERKETARTAVINGGAIGEDVAATNLPSSSSGVEASTIPIVMVVRDLSEQGLSEIPTPEFERRDTEVLNLSKNNLVSLPAEVQRLSQLKMLNLSHNNLTGLPAEIGQLSELEYLEVAYNKLTGLPYELGNLKNLQLLDLRGNDYAEADLEVIKRGIPKAIILTDK